MEYWVLKELVDEYNCTGFDCEYNVDLVTSFDGRKLSDNWKPLPVKFLYRSRKKGDCPSLQIVPLFSAKAIKVLREIMGENVEYLEVTGEASKFTIVNVIKLVDALDREKSVLEYFDDGRIFNYTKIVLDSRKLSTENIFKLIEFPRTDIIVSDKFKDAVEKAGLKGFAFEKIEVS